MTATLDPKAASIAPARVYLEPEDDSATIRGRIERGVARQPQVEVFVPYGQPTLRSRVGMLLLRRFVEDSLIAVYLITDDSEVRRTAREQAIPASGTTLTGDSLGSALRREADRTPAGYARYLRERRVRSTERWRSIRHVGGVLAMALLPPLAAVWVLAPTATISLKIPVESVDQALNLRVSALASTVDLQDATVPGRVVEVPVDISVSGRTSGAVPDTNVVARGTVRFISRSDQPVRVPGGTRVATNDSIVFTTQTEVIAHPGLPQGVSVAVSAQEPGALSNVAARAISRIEDTQLASVLRVENEAALTGGADAPERAVTEADYQRLRAEAINQARDRALEDIERRLTGDSAIAPGSLRLRIATEDLTQRIGTPANSVTLTLSGTGRALTFHSEDLRTIVRRRIAVDAGDEQAAGAQLSVSLGKSLTADNDIAVFETRVEGTVGRWLDDAAVRAAVAGKTPADARRALTRLAPESAPTIRLTAPWADRVSPFHWRITVVQSPG